MIRKEQLKKKKKEILIKAIKLLVKIMFLINLKHYKTDQKEKKKKK